jgi:CheY-like chemotaxis protein
MIQSILIADDEPGHVSMLEALLKDRGYKVVTCSDGDEAVEKAARFKPDLIILDIMMPRMAGTDAASLLKSDERTKNIPIFFVTAVISEEDQVKSKDKAYKMFAKPIKFFELLDAITKLSN